MRRILQAQGAEVIHLGHDRSVHDIVTAAIQEDAHGIAVSSYQGGHMEYFSYMVEALRSSGRSDIGVFGGGGGTITDKEIHALQERGVRRIYSVEDGRRLGLVGMIDDMIQQAARAATIDIGQFDAAKDLTSPVVLGRLPRPLRRHTRRRWRLPLNIWPLSSISQRVNPWALQV